MRSKSRRQVVCSVFGRDWEDRDEGRECGTAGGKGMSVRLGCAAENGEGEKGFGLLCTEYGGTTLQAWKLTPLVLDPGGAVVGILRPWRMG